MDIAGYSNSVKLICNLNHQLRGGWSNQPVIHAIIDHGPPLTSWEQSYNSYYLPGLYQMSEKLCENAEW